MVKTKSTESDPTDNTSNRTQLDLWDLERTAASGEASASADSKGDAACQLNSAASVSMNRQIRRCKAVRNAWTESEIRKKNSRATHPIALLWRGRSPVWQEAAATVAPSSSRWTRSHAEFVSLRRSICGHTCFWAAVAQPQGFRLLPSDAKLVHCLFHSRKNQPYFCKHCCFVLL